MRRIRQGAMATFVLSLLAMPAGAGVLAPKKPSESKVLLAGPGGIVCAPFEEEMSIAIDDNGEDVDFTVPPGKVFMVTDVAAVLVGTPDSEGGMYIGQAGVDKPIFVSATLNAHGVAHVQTHLQTPVRVPGLPCVNLVGIGVNPIPALNDIRLTGFLAADH